MEFPRQEHWEWIAISSSRGSSQARDQIHVSCVSCTGRWILYHWAAREAHIYPSIYHMILKSSAYLMYLKNCFMASRIVLQVGFSKKQILRQTFFLVLLLFSHSVVSDSLWPHGLQPGFPVLQYLPEFAQSHVHWVSDVMQTSHPVTAFSSCPQSFPASGSFPMSWLFASGGQSIGASAAGSVIPMNIQDWFPLGLTGLLSFQSKGLSRVFFFVYKMFIQEHPWDQHLWKGGGNRSGSREKSSPVANPAASFNTMKSSGAECPFRVVLNWHGVAWASFTLLEKRKSKFQRARKKSLQFKFYQFS